jgi:hypothetical protein
MTGGDTYFGTATLAMSNEAAIAVITGNVCVESPARSLLHSTPGVLHEVK